KFDRVPKPLPRGPRGRDRICIYEDADGDSRYKLVRHFDSDLNLVSGFAPGYDGVFVGQPPYLVFDPDRNDGDVTYFEPSGKEMTDEAWSTDFVRCLGVGWV